jgi:hypothetical protein
LIPSVDSPDFDFFLMRLSAFIARVGLQKAADGPGNHQFFVRANDADGDAT